MSKIRLHGSSSGYTEIAPVAASGNNTLTLPDDGTILSKDAAGAVGVTSVVTDTIKVGTAVTIGESGVNVVGVVTATSGIVGLTSTGMPTGSIIQVVQETSTARTTSSCDVGGQTGQMISASITPTSSSSKILINAQFYMSLSSGPLRIASRLIINDDYNINRGNGNTSGTNRRYVCSASHVISNSDPRTISYTFLDEPATTSSTKYGFTFLHASGSSRTFAMNYSEANGNTVQDHNGRSVIQLIEVAG